MKVKVWLCLLVFGCVTSQAGGEGEASIATSVVRLRDFMGTEKQLLQGLQKFISYQEERQESLKKSSGYEDDLATIERILGPIKELEEQARKNVSQAAGAGNSSHPTACYLAVKHFLSHWSDTIKDNSTWRGSLILEMAGLEKVKFPSVADLQFARTVILRLQLVYNISVSDVMQGRVLGNQGPPLTPADAYDLGLTALRDNLPDLARDWLELAIEKETSTNASFSTHHAYVKLARIYSWEEDYEKMAEAIAKAMKSRDVDIRQEAVKIRAGEGSPVVNSLETLPKWWDNYTQLCTGPPENKQLRRVDVCRLRRGLVPYRRYREEVLSARPYVAILHDVISSRDVDAMLGTVITEYMLTPESIEPAKDVLRTGEIAYHYDNATERMLATLGDALSLVMVFPNNTEIPMLEYHPLGGSMYPHVDYQPSLNFGVMEGAGDRMLSLRLFMNDVEAGGAEIFNLIGLRVQPRKGSVLFWHNHSPLGDLEPLTSHAACPVAVGEKIVSNMHVWTKDNTHRLVCGSRRRHSHFTVDQQRFLDRWQPRNITEYEYDDEY